VTVESLEETLRRLKKERAEADRRYNEALTTLDRALPGQPDIRDGPRPYDDSQLGSLNDTWNTIPSPPEASGLRGRLTGYIWRTIGPYLQRQLTFNSRVVDHLNRQIIAERDAHRAAVEMSAGVRQAFASLALFQTRLIEYLQHVTAYVDTRDRESGAGALILNRSLSGLAEGVDKRWESQSSRDLRLEARAAALQSEHEAVRTLAASAQQASLTLKREVEAILQRQRVQAGHGVQERLVPERGAETRLQDAVIFPTLDAYKYLGFEDQFRGSRDTIRARLESYLPFFRGVADVLDVGCGRGEFLELLAAAGVRARGIDLNHEMAETCRGRGLDVTEADAVSYLTSVADASLGGIFAAQVVEHLKPQYLLRFLELASQKLRPGGRIVLETLNPACWVAFFDSYIRDITHVWPLHPDTLRYLVTASGFSRVDVEYRSPVPSEHKLQPIVLPQAAEPALVEMAETINANSDKLNGRIYSHLDYAVIGER
jgi:O-antigen chain-terminating methyltransferase